MTRSAVGRPRGTGPVEVPPPVSSRMKPPPAQPDATPPVVIFDGECGLCARSVRFIESQLGPDPMRLVASASPDGAALLRAHGFPQDGPGSIVVVEHGQAFTKSAALLRIARRLRPPWRWLGLLRVIPRPLRDAAYGLLALHRRRFFAAPACKLPPRRSP
jgi:predicted DCC family thiol-disulfide oxidoreductase YuxK